MAPSSEAKASVGTVPVLRRNLIYLPYAEKSRAAALAGVDAYGLVQDVCGLPFFDKPGVAAEGQAFFLLMETAREWWQKRR